MTKSKMQCENCLDESDKMYICQVRVADLQGDPCLDVWKLCSECVSQLAVECALVSATMFDGVMAEQLPTGGIGVTE